MKLAKLGDGPEIFHTIQGEGVSAGLPAVFIRASRCNLHCVWCDTDHTWNFEGTPWPHEKDAVPGYAKYRKADVTFEITSAGAAQRILEFTCPRVVITGGEPLLQEEAFLEMMRQIREEMPECVFEVETNATRIPCPAFADAVDQFNISPKLSNAGMPESMRLNDDALRYFAASPKAWFKFVVSSPVDLAEIKMLQSRYEIPRGRILLMPEGRTSNELDKTAAQLADLCRELGFRFCDRLHIRLWGDRRGV
ncbi:MAG: 7-carboxy-7-deazaguanine synthase QueE [Verrucomicrobiaceae bacterium]|nr:MAG: 7-carboxy-7-deazaguanine synthase QueE [Verrucomicrobiaceae bacterium]